MRWPQPRLPRLRQAGLGAIVALVAIGVSGSAAAETRVIGTAVDLANGVHFLVVTDPSNPFYGQFGFAKYGVGIYWASGASVSSNPDGTRDVTYVGPGFFDPTAEIDLFLGLHVPSGARNPVSLDLAVELTTANGAGAGRLIADGVSYPIATVSDVPSPDAAIQSIVAAAAAGDWSVVHALFIPQVQAGVTQAAFETEMEDGIAAFGSVTDVSTTGPSTRYDLVSWQSADVPIEFTFDVGGDVVVRPSRIELVYMNSAWRISSLDELGAAPPDETPPTSLAGALNASYTTPSVDVPFTATDARTGIANVELWWRFRPTSAGVWTSFALGPQGPTSPIPFGFSLGDGFYEFYTIAVDGADNRESAPASRDTATQKTAVSAWSAGIRVNDDSGSAQQSAPDVAIALDDTAHAVWRDARADSTQDVFYSRLAHSSGTWSANQRVNDTATGVQGDAHIAVDGNGNAYAIWLDTRNGRNDMYSAKRPAATGVWSANVRVSTVTSFLEQRAPAIAVSSSGEAVAVWYRRTGTNKYHIYSARLAAGASAWSAEIKITSDQAAPKESPEVTVGPDGKAYAVWMQSTNVNADIWFASLPAGGAAWSANIRISDDVNTNLQLDPLVGVDAAGNVLAAWADWGPTPDELRVRKRAANGTWSPSVLLAANGTNSPSLSVASDGSAFATWTDGVNSFNPVLWGSDRNPTTGAWSAPEALNDTGSGAAHSPAGTLGATRDVVAWGNSSGANADIYARTR